LMIQRRGKKKRGAEVHRGWAGGVGEWKRKNRREAWADDVSTGRGLIEPYKNARVGRIPCEEGEKKLKAEMPDRNRNWYEQVRYRNGVERILKTGKSGAPWGKQGGRKGGLNHPK